MNIARPRKAIRTALNVYRVRTLTLKCDALLLIHLLIYYLLNTITTGATSTATATIVSTATDTTNTNTQLLLVLIPPFLLLQQQLLLLIFLELLLQGYQTTNYVVICQGRYIFTMIIKYPMFLSGI